MSRLQYRSAVIAFAFLAAALIVKCGASIDPSTIWSAHPHSKHLPTEMRAISVALLLVVVWLVGKVFAVGGHWLRKSPEQGSAEAQAAALDMIVSLGVPRPNWFDPTNIPKAKKP